MIKYYILNYDKKEYMECTVENAKRYNQIVSFFHNWLNRQWGNITLTVTRKAIPDDFTQTTIRQYNML